MQVTFCPFPSPLHVLCQNLLVGVWVINFDLDYNIIVPGQQWKRSECFHDSSYKHQYYQSPFASTQLLSTLLTKWRNWFLFSSVWRMGGIYSSCALLSETHCLFWQSNNFNQQCFIQRGAYIFGCQRKPRLNMVMAQILHTVLLTDAIVGGAISISSTALYSASMCVMRAHAHHALNDMCDDHWLLAYLVH